MGVVQILEQYAAGLLHGVAVTLELAILVWIVGIVIGSALGVAQARLPVGIGWITRAVAFVLTSVPTIVLLFWFHYPAQTLIGVQLNPFITSAFTLGLVNIFAVAEIIRPALVSFPSGLIATGKVAGLSRRQILWKIEFPLIVRNVIPALLTLQVVMLQATIFASLISLDEIFRIAQRINAQVYRPVQVYSVLAIFFLALCLPLNAVAAILQRRFRQKLAID